MNRVLVLFLLVFASSQSFAIDLGDGSDGSCDTAGSATTTLNSSKRTYQCTSLTINSNSSVFKGVGGSAVVIKVMGAVTIQSGFTFDLSGADGTEGDSIGPTISGASGGAGGSSGGSGTGVDGNNGNGSGAGVKGIHVVTTNTKSFGGGGGGASYKNVSSTNPTNGSSDNGTSASAGSAGSNGSAYGSESSFDINSLVGGSGGAAGGAGDNGGSTTYYGSSGGGGGGTIVIVAGGNITINGILKVNGGNGGGTSSAVGNGGGGAGSGGTIWLMSDGNISVSGTGSILANGGTGGTNSTSGFGDYGVGGDGGDGRIRLDDLDGTVSNSGSISPSAYSTTFKSTVSTSSLTTNEFKSAVNCGRVSLEEKYNFGLNFIFAFSIVGICFQFFRRNKYI